MAVRSQLIVDHRYDRRSTSGVAIVSTISRGGGFAPCPAYPSERPEFFGHRRDHSYGIHLSCSAVQPVLSGVSLT
jgi:hypothetical protein